MNRLVVRSLSKKNTEYRGPAHPLDPTKLEQHVVRCDRANALRWGTPRRPRHSVVETGGTTGDAKKGEFDLK
jgi:hypothetical protein